MSAGNRRIFLSSSGQAIMLFLRRKGAILISTAIVAVCLWYIVQTFQWREIGKVLLTADLAWVLIGGGSSIMIYWFLRTVRWSILLKRMNSPVPFVDLYFCTAVSLSFSIFTPLQSGEMSKIELLKKYGMVSRFPGYASFLVERVVDLSIMLTLASASILFILNILPNRSYTYYIIGILSFGLIVGIVFLWKLRLKGRMQELLNHIRQCVSDTRTLFLVITVSCLSWASVAISWQIFLYAGLIKIDFVQALALMSVVALVSILSLVPGGLGISEVSTAHVLQVFGFTTANAQAGAIVLRFYSLVAIILGLAHLGAWKLLRTIRHERARHIESDKAP